MIVTKKLGEKMTENNRLSVKLPGLDLKIQSFQLQVVLALVKNMPNIMI